MAGILKELITRKWQDKALKEERSAELYGNVVRDYLSGKSDLSDEAAEFAMGEFMKVLPKEAQDSFKAFVASKQGQRRLPGNSPTANQPQSNGGLPAPPASGPTGGLPEPPVTATGGLTPPPPPMGEAQMMGADSEGGSPVPSTSPAPNNIPLPPAMAQSASLGQQGFSQSTPTPAPASQPGARQLPPPPFMRRDPMDQSAYQVAGVQAMVEEARRIGLTDAKYIVNFINNKQVDRDPTAASKVYNLGPGAALIDPTGKVLYTNPSTTEQYVSLGSGGVLDTKTGKVIAPTREPDSPNGPFEAWYQRFREENKREPTTAEIKAIESQFSPSYGPPLVVTMGPDGPVYTPRPQAAGAAAPRTVFDQFGNPTTGGQRGVSLTPPPVPPAEVGRELAGIKNVFDQFTEVESILPQVHGPAFGQITLAQVNKLGGLGLDAPTIERVVRFRNLVTSQSFKDGGKSLTGTEKEEFIANTPSETDTFQQAAIKAKVAMEILRRNFKNRVDSIPERQSSQLPIARNGLTPPPAQSGTPASGKVKVRRKDNGKVGLLPESSFDPAKYERVP